MALIVQKYGGSSVADGKKIKNLARRIARAKEEGNQVVAAVSAMGHTADNLIKSAYQVNEQPGDREPAILLSTGEKVKNAVQALHKASELEAET